MGTFLPFSHLGIKVSSINTNSDTSWYGTYKYTTYPKLRFIKELDQVLSMTKLYQLRTKHKLCQGYIVILR